MLPDDKVTMSVVIDREVKELIEQYAKELDLSASKFARNLIYVGLDDYKLCKKVGIIAVGKMFRNLMQSIETRKKNTNSNSKA